MRAQDDSPAALVFGRSSVTPFHPRSSSCRAASAWRAAGLLTLVCDRELGIDPRPLTLHEARHTFASLMIAAGVNAKALSTYMEHANIAVTMDRYGHLMPGNEDEAAGLLDAYLERAQARLADGTGAQTGARSRSKREIPANRPLRHYGTTV